MAELRREIQKILDSTHDGMIAVDTDGVITVFNKSAERLTGIAAADALGKNVDDVIVNTRLPVVLKTGVSELNRRQPLRTTTIITNRMPVFDDAGAVIGAIAVFRDISELIELAGQITNLSEVTETLEATLNATQDAISVVDQNGRGILVNPAYLAMTGAAKESLIGSTKLVESDSVHRQVLMTKSQVKGVRLRVGASRKEVIANGAPIMVNKQLRGSVEVIHDLTELNEIYRKLDQAKKIIRTLEAKYTFDDIVGSAPLFREAVDKAKLAASTPATVLISGESGTGKELFAHAIHNASDRRYAQFVRVNCAALSEHLLESELFGYVEGAFTGAAKGGKIGLFEKANGGTLFLDEIGEMSPGTQAKLLRVLQEREILPVGDTRPIAVDVRVIAATNKDLQQAIADRQFREDLYYRLNYFPIVLPPLRLRREDIGDIARALMIKLNQEYGRSIESIDSHVIEALEKMEWRGNVRELENTLGRAIINMQPGDTVLRVAHLPAHTSGAAESRRGELSDAYHGQTLTEALASAERRIIEAALEANDYNRERTAAALGISVRALYYKLQRFA